MKTVMKIHHLLSSGVSKIAMEHVKLANDEAVLEERIKMSLKEYLALLMPSPGAPDK